MRGASAARGSTAVLGATALIATFLGCAAHGPDCSPPPARPGCAPDATPIRRLTRQEYVNSVRDLLAPLAWDAQAIGQLVELIPDPGVDGFDSDATAQTPSPLLLEQYGTSARRIADATVPNVEALAPCPSSTAAGERACGERFVRDFAYHAFRRPLAADEVTRFDRAFEAWRSAQGFAAAVSTFVEAVLQSPSFLYRPELGEPGCSASASAPLTGFEVASRLSYLLWASTPDDALLDAAARGELASSAQIEAQARRMLADDRARDGVSEITRQWLALSVLDGIYKDRTVFSDFVLPRAKVMRAAALLWVDHWFWEEGGTLPGLFTSTTAYADPWLAGLYGASAPQDDGDLWPVELDPAQRAGFLTQAGVLAALAHETMTSPVKRGVYVLDRFLCEGPPPPPPGVITTIPAAPAGTQQTMRQRLEQHATGPCLGCHASIDGIGFGFEQYDAIGRWQTTDDGLPIDASGTVPGSGDAAGPFDGAVALSRRLAGSREVARCVARRWFHHGFGRVDAAGDACTLGALSASLDATGGDLRELLVAIATSEAFRRRSAPASGGGPR